MAVAGCSQSGHPTSETSHPVSAVGAPIGAKTEAAPRCLAAQLHARVRSDAYIGMGKVAEGFRFTNVGRRRCALDGTPVVDGTNGLGEAVNVREIRLGNPEGAVEPLVLGPGKNVFAVALQGLDCSTRSPATRITMVRLRFKRRQVLALNLARQRVRRLDQPPFLSLACPIAITSFERRPVG